ncbi:hypothetical protein [Fluviicola taffensis]|uniref:PKD domain-containing protein n=1 Tax=Fluviicola taffensis (strain DSM 16823 / NCIMB 13979 / RW262) TaxID=755732 RepID=F2IAX3_FLUTR|nr:hypothetical protein [Fluviicola taffensis]AEA45297.1 hypothetical protein Fluta_3325 [Fluviicola taffensis DSM 16823]
MKSITLLILASTLIALNSCKKKNDCPINPEDIVLNSNGPVFEGWPLHLWTESGFSYTYHWQGPNGWKKDYDYSTNTSGSETIESMTQAKAGVYIVNIRDGNCVIKKGSVNVSVIPPSNAPCSVNNNTSTSTVIGVGGTNYTSVFGNSNSNYYVQASNSSQAITFNFKGEQAPLPGIYKSNDTYYPSEQNKVGVYIGTGFQDYQMEPDVDVYVNKVNGKTVISFCSAGFYNPVGNATITISAKVTVP